MSKRELINYKTLIVKPSLSNYWFTLFVKETIYKQLGIKTV